MCRGSNKGRLLGALTLAWAALCDDVVEDAFLPVPGLQPEQRAARVALARRRSGGGCGWLLRR